MHVHGNYLMMNAPIEAGVARMEKQRAADVRKKLTNSIGDQADCEEAFLENVSIPAEEESGEPAARSSRKRARLGGPFRAADVSEDESANEMRTSIWA